MRTIHKVKLTPDGRVSMPLFSTVLSVGVQGDDIFAWYECYDSDESTMHKRFHIVGTGHDLGVGGGRFIGTVQLMNGRLVFHVYEIKP